MTGYHRKHAIRILAAQPDPPLQRPAACRIYGEAVKEALIVLWEAADRFCGKRLKTLLPQLVEAIEWHKHLQLEQQVPGPVTGDECSYHRSSALRCQSSCVRRTQEENRQPGSPDGSGPNICGFWRGPAWLPGGRFRHALWSASSRQFRAHASFD